MTHTRKALIVAMLFGAAAAPLPTHAATSDTTSAPPPSVVAFDQKLSGTSVMVDYVRLPAAGYVAVYGADAAGKPGGEPLGYTRMDAGYHRQIKVELSKQPAQGDRLWVSLYKDTDTDPAFKPGAGDKPVWTKLELPPENMILIR